MNLNTDEPTQAILSYLYNLMQDYNIYRKDNNLPAMSLHIDPLLQLNINAGLIANLYLTSTESITNHQSLHHTQEQLNFHIDIIYSTTLLRDNAYTHLLQIGSDLKAALTAMQHYDFGQGINVTNRSHPTFTIPANATENPDLEYAFGRLSFSVDVAYDYIDNPEIISGATFNWQLLLKNRSHKQGENYE